MPSPVLLLQVAKPQQRLGARPAVAGPVAVSAILTIRCARACAGVRGVLLRMPASEGECLASLSAGLCHCLSLTFHCLAGTSEGKLLLETDTVTREQEILMRVRPQGKAGVSCSKTVTFLALKHCLFHRLSGTACW